MELPLDLPDEEKVAEIPQHEAAFLVFIDGESISFTKDITSAFETDREATNTDIDRAGQEIVEFFRNSRQAMATQALLFPLLQEMYHKILEIGKDETPTDRLRDAAKKRGIK